MTDDNGSLVDAILSRARHLIFDFDGAVCALTTSADAFGLPPARKTGLDDSAGFLALLPDARQNTTAAMDAELASLELPEAATAHIHETLAACRDSGRTAAVISRHEKPAVTTWLDQHDLGGQVSHVIAPGPGQLAAGQFLLDN